MKKISKAITDLIFYLMSMLHHWKLIVGIKSFQKRFRYMKEHGIYPAYKKQDKILFLIAHIVPGAGAFSEGERLQKAERIISCIDHLLEFQSHTNFTIKLLTMEGLNLFDALPLYQQQLVALEYVQKEDPMYAEYEAFKVFKKHQPEYDYYFFLEDDIMVSDAFFIDKIALFNEQVNNPNYLLLPHRYEMYEGEKFYVDQIFFFPREKPHYRLLESSVISMNGFKFCLFENPHAGCYCINREQLEVWIKSGYEWKDKIVAFGPLESAATFCHFENFELFNPHPENINFLEVQHYGTKYSKQHFLEQSSKEKHTSSIQ